MWNNVFYGNSVYPKACTVSQGKVSIHVRKDSTIIKKYLSPFTGARSNPLTRLSLSWFPFVGQAAKGGGLRVSSGSSAKQVG